MKAENEIDIGSLLRKYIKLLVFVDNLALSSIRAYLSDLGQILTDNPKSFTWLQNLATDEDTSLLKTSRIFTTSESCLIDLVNKGLRNWSNLAPASRNRKFSVIKGFLFFLYSEGVLSRDLSSQIICPKVPKKLPHFLSLDEVLSVLSVLKRKDYFEGPEALLFVLLYGGGLRISEACSLTWNQFSNDFLNLRVKGKGGKERMVVFPPLVQKCLQYQYQKIESGPYIFGEKALEPQKGYYLIKNLGKAAGLSKSLNPHALRHSFATHLLVNGIDIRILQQILGHESLAATEKYLHLNIDHLSVTVEKLHPLSSFDSESRT